MDKTTQILKAIIFTLVVVGIALSAIGLLLTLTGLNAIAAHLCSALGTAITAIALIVAVFYYAK